MIPTRHSLFRLARRVRLGVLAGCLAFLAADVRAQVPADQAADMLLNSARKAYNEHNYPFAATRFREFLQKHGGHPQANAARYGLALSLLNGPEPNPAAAIEALNPLANDKNFPDHPYALYHLGLANRALGVNELAQARAKPPEAPQREMRAAQHFNEAARFFAGAADAFAAKLPKDGIDPKAPPPELDWAARSRCDRAEMLLRLGNPKEARAAAEPFLKDPALAKSQYRKLGLYYHGFASFLLQDYLVAGRVLNQLAPFDDPVFGTHAHYLLGRIFQVTGEGAEAGVAYDAVLADYEKQKKAAVEALKRPDQFKNNPHERARLEALVKNPPPDHVAGSVFFSACLRYEGGKFGDALPRFQAFAKDFPKSSLQPEALLRVGFCQVQLKQYPEAIQTLTPLKSQPRLADQALLWLGKAQAGAALALDPAKAQDRDNALRAALGTLRSAADEAGKLANNDPDAKQRRGEALVEAADTMQHLKQYKEAANLYQQVINEKMLPNRPEELMQRLSAALHLAGDYQASDQVCASFQKEFPQSPLLAAVLFRAAENAYFNALAAEKRPDYPTKAADLAKLFEEAGKRYKAVIDRFPEFERVNLARYGLAMTLFRRNEFDKAQEVLEAIPAPERTGDLAYVPYLLADCLIRQAPAKAEDALADGILREKLTNAQQMLEAFVAANPKAPETPDALLKLGYCHTRLALQNAQAQDRNAGLNNARQIYERLIREFPKEPQAAQAALERAKCMAYAGDKNGAANELRNFTRDPLQQTAVAPYAVLQLAVLLREQNKAPEAAQLLGEIRPRFEPKLKDHPEQVALLRYHHGVCLQEAGKLPEARAQLEAVIQAQPGKPIAAEAALRSGQCRIAEGKKMLADARQRLAAGNLKPDQHNAAMSQFHQGVNALNEAAQGLERRADEFRQALPNEPARARMYYEAAWAYRAIADDEVATTRTRMRQELQRKLQDEANRKAAPGTKAPAVPLPEVPRASIPVQPAEDRAKAAYRRLIESFSDVLLGVEGRFELAEMLAERNDLDGAIKLLAEAIDKEPADKQPSAELMDKVRIRLGACLAAKKDYERALEKFEAVAGNPKSPLAAQGQYRAGECLLEMGEPARAVAKLAVFRDKPEFHNVPGVSDRALLRLGHALAASKQWDASRQALELLTQRFGNSPWVNEARYGIGWAYQNAKQYDPAVNAYNQVIANTANELAAKAHLQIGLCRLEQKRYGDAVATLLIVPFTFDYPDLSAVALCEAARALIADKKPEQAERLLRRVVKEYPQSEWAKVAQERLDALLARAMK